MEALIGYVVRALVDQPDKVEIRASEAEGGHLFELKVAQEDVGKVIGRDGRTINALRTLLGTAAQKQGVRARLEILDDRRKPSAEPEPRAEQDASEPAGQ